MKQDQPLLSVVVPVYNVEKYLDRCIRSIVGQTYRNLEIILVDDGATDSCGKICDDWEKKDFRIKVLHKKNGGLVSARKAGLNLASGDYIAYVDGDDWIEKDMYECLMGLILRDQSDLVTSGLIRDYGNHSVVENEKVPAGKYTDESLNSLLYHVINTNHFFESQINMHITNKVFRKDILLRYQMNIPDEAKIGEDADVTYPYIFECKSMSVSGRCFYHYVMRGDSIMGNASHARSSEIMRSIFSEYINKNENRIKNIKEQLYQVMVFFSYMSETDNILKMKDKKHFPFEEIKKHDRIILYGTGRFGKAMNALLKSERYCEIVAWADKVKSENVILPEEIMDYCFDKILLAVINAAVADDIEEMLVELGIDRQKICRIKKPFV